MSKTPGSMDYTSNLLSLSRRDTSRLDLTKVTPVSTHVRQVPVLSGSSTHPPGRITPDFGYNLLMGSV